MARAGGGELAGWTRDFREFGRVFTRRAGLLREAPYDPALSLLESRLVFELARAPRPSGNDGGGAGREENGLGRGGRLRLKDLQAALGVDKGYLSRVVGGLARRDVVSAASGAGDARERWLALTPRGRALWRRIDRVSQERARGVLAPMGRLCASELMRHLRAAALHLAHGGIDPGEVRLRRPEPGDLGWVIQRHGEIYWEEFGWDLDFEALVAGVVAAFAKRKGSRRERAWIAHARGVRLGCVFLVREGASTAKLRILLVEPAARGLGLGSRLTRECVAFARKAGYRRLVLWTNAGLDSARRIYEAEGFALDREEPHESFGKRLVGQYWSKALG